MASVTLPKRADREGTAEPKTQIAKKGRVDNERSETMGSFALVVMMPLVIGLLVLITIYLAAPLANPSLGGG